MAPLSVSMKVRHKYQQRSRLGITAFDVFDQFYSDLVSARPAACMVYHRYCAKQATLNSINDVLILSIIISVY